MEAQLETMTANEAAETLKKLLVEALSLKKAVEELPYTLTVDEVAKVLRIGKTKAYELVNTGQIPAKKIMGMYRIPRDAFLQWLNSTDEKGCIEKIICIAGRR